MWVVDVQLDRVKQILDFLDLSGVSIDQILVSTADDDLLDVRTER